MARLREILNVASASKPSESIVTPEDVRRSEPVGIVLLNVVDPELFGTTPPDQPAELCQDPSPPSQVVSITSACRSEVLDAHAARRIARDLDRMIRSFVAVVTMRSRSRTR